MKTSLMKSQELNIPKSTNYTITRTGLIFHRDVSFEEWCSLSTSLGAVARGVAFIVGDWLVYGERRFATPSSRVSSERYNQAVAMTGLDRQTLHGYSHVSRKVPHHCRHDVLSWEHHKIAAKLPKREQAKRLNELAKFARDGRPISTRKFRESVSIKVKPEPQPSEVDRLRFLNAKLIAALEDMLSVDKTDGRSRVIQNARSLVAQAKGEQP